MAVGPPFLFLGVLVGGPVLAAAVRQGRRLAIVALRSATLEVGVENVRRNPRRSAATALALVIGVFLVVLVTAGGGAFVTTRSPSWRQFGGPDVMVISANGDLTADFVQPGAGDRRASTATAEVYFGIGRAHGRRSGGPPRQRRRTTATRRRWACPTRRATPPCSARTTSSCRASRPTVGLQIGDPVIVRFGSGEERDSRIGAISAHRRSRRSRYISEEMALEADPGIVPFSLQVTAESGAAPARRPTTSPACPASYAGLEVHARQLLRQRSSRASSTSSSPPPAASSPSPWSSPCSASSTRSCCR